MGNSVGRVTRPYKIIFSIGISLGVAHVAVAAPPTEESLAHLAMADEFASAGVAAISGQQVAPPMIRQSAALLKAACYECDFEPRFPRLLTEASLQMNDVDGAIEALKRYRAIQLPEIQNDQFAQVQLIDLYLSKQESLDAKVIYLKPLLSVASLPDPVKSHIAWKCSTLLQQKFDSQGADAMLAQAIQFNPLNPEALQSQFVAAQASGNPQRVAAALVALLKSNPAQPLVMGSLADELASVGQPDAAVGWYKRSFVLSQQLGITLDDGRYLNYAAALLAMDQVKEADEAAGMLLASEPANIGAATVRLLAARASVKPPAGGQPGDPDVVQKARFNALSALSAQLGTLHARLHGVTGAATTQAATTQPVNLIGDIGTDAPMVRDMKSRPDVTPAQTNFSNGYAESLADLIFYYTYFDPQPANANKLLDSLRTLRPSDDAELTRLEGFAFLSDGKRDEAKVKFSAVADHDVLAKMGLLLLDPQGKSTPADASKLLTDHPAGLLGAILIDALRDKGGKTEITADATAVANEAAAFPIRMLDLLDRNQTAKFYTLVADPLHSGRNFDEPALVRVSIKNVGDYDLSVGKDGALRPDLWFDVAVQGGSNPPFPGVVYDRIAGPLVLKAKQLQSPGSDQVVRVDQGPLIPFLADRPKIAVSLLYSVFTNPIGQSGMAGQQGTVVPGPGGYRKQFNSPIERHAAPITTQSDVQHLLDPLANGRSDQKVHTLQLLSSYITALRTEINGAKNVPAAADASSANQGAGAIAPPGPVGTPAASAVAGPALISADQNLIATFSNAIRSSLRDPSPTVRYWAQAKLAEIAEPAARAQMASMMVQGTDWEQRVLGLILLRDLLPEQSKPIAKTLGADPIDYVKALAAATIDVADLPPTTRPATTSPAALLDTPPAPPAP